MECCSVYCRTNTSTGALHIVRVCEWVCVHRTKCFFCECLTRFTRHCCIVCHPNEREISNSSSFNAASRGNQIKLSKNCYCLFVFHWWAKFSVYDFVAYNIKRTFSDTFALISGEERNKHTTSFGLTHLSIWFKLVEMYVNCIFNF